jgi:hypothetical protein
MPFGCGIQMGNLYALTPGQVMAVSVGGPLASLALLFVDAALAHWGLLSPAFALSLLRVTLALLLFNLLPALPLDGGRMLYALTARPLGRDKAVKLGAWLGYATALVLLVGAIIMGIKAQRFNLTLPACAVFILKGIQDDREALRDARRASVLNALRRTNDPIPMCLCAVDESTPILKALRHAAPDAATLYAVYRSDRFEEFMDEGELVRKALICHAARVGDIKHSPATLTGERHINTAGISFSRPSSLAHSSKSARWPCSPPAPGRRR